MHQNADTAECTKTRTLLIVKVLHKLQVHFVSIERLCWVSSHWCIARMKVPCTAVMSRSRPHVALEVSCYFENWLH